MARAKYEIQKTTYDIQQMVQHTAPFWTTRCHTHKPNEIVYQAEWVYSKSRASSASATRLSLTRIVLTQMEMLLASDLPLHQSNWMVHRIKPRFSVWFVANMTNLHWANRLRIQIDDIWTLRLVRLHCPNLIYLKLLTYSAKLGKRTAKR